MVMDDEVALIDNINNLYRKFPVMRKLRKDQVCIVKHASANSIVIKEGCIEWYKTELTKDDVKQVAAFFRELSAVMGTNK